MSEINTAEVKTAAVQAAEVQAAEVQLNRTTLTSPARAADFQADGVHAGSVESALGTVGPTRRTHRIMPLAEPSGQASQASQASQTSQASQASQAGQTTAEYALLTGAIALLVAAVTAWATSTGKIGRLLDAVFNYLTKAIS